MAGSSPFLRVLRLLSSVMGVTADQHPGTQASSLVLKNATVSPISFVSSSSNSLQVLPKPSSSSASAPPQRRAPPQQPGWSHLPGHPPSPHLKWLPPSWMYLSLALEYKLRDVGDLVWPGQYYVFTVKQNFFIKWLKCILWAVNQACRDSSSALAFCSAFKVSCITAFCSLTHLWLEPFRVSWGSLPRGPAQPTRLLQLAAVPAKAINLRTP